MNLKNKYYLIRHGESESNVLNVNDSQGDPNNHLTKKGMQEVENCARKFVEEGVVIDKIISSPFPRAKESAEIILNIVNITDREIYFTQLLQEMNHGSHTFGKKIQPEPEKENAYDELHSQHGDGESFWDVRKRASELIEELENKYHGKTLLLVTHGSPLWMFCSAANGLDEEETMEFMRKRSSNTGYFIKNADPILIT